MPTYAQLEQEAAWRAEIVPDAIRWFIAELRARLNLTAGAVGCKGDNKHLRGSHRSRRWIKTSAYCTNRTYTVTHPDDLAGDENWCVGIDISLPTALLLEVCRRLDAAVRAGLIEEASEWYGNTDGDDRVDGYNNIEDRVASSDSSHLWHLHVTLKRRYANTLEVLQRLLSILLGDDMSVTAEKEIHSMYAATFTGGSSCGRKVPFGASTSNSLVAKADYGLQLAEATLAAVKGDDDAAQIIAAIREQNAELRAALLADLPAAIIALLPEDTPATVEALTEALRKVLGTLDGATPAAG